MILFRARVLLAWALVAMVAGCAAVSRKPALELTDIDTGTPLHIVSVIAGEAAAGGGPAEAKPKGWFASIKSKKSTKATEPVVEEVPVDTSPLHAALGGIDLGQVMIYELNASFRKGKPFDVQNIHGVGQPIGDIAKHFETVPETALLLLNTRYRFVDKTKILVIESDAELFVRDPKSTGKARSKPVYTNRIISQLDLSTTSEAQWQKAVQESMRLGLKEVAQLVAMDLSVAKRWESQSEKQTWTSADSGKKLKGFQVEGHDDRIIIRLNDGQLISLPKDRS